MSTPAEDIFGKDKKRFRKKISQDLVNLFKNLNYKRLALIDCLGDLKQQERDLWLKARKDYEVPEEIMYLTVDHKKCEIRETIGEDDD